MKILAAELKKLFSSKIFLMIISAVFIINAYLCVRTANSEDAKPYEYRAVYSEIEGLTDEEKLNWLDERANDVTGQYKYNRNMLYELQEECYNIVNYKSYLESIDQQAKSMTSISIFADPDTFNYRSIVKTPPAYKNVKNVQPVFDVSKGIILATDNNFTDILIGFILLFSVLSLMISDREQGMSGLLFPLKKGRGCLILSKVLALAAVLFTTVILIYAESLIISGYMYGLGDLLRPVQSLNGFIGCNLNISVAGYIVLYMLFKFCALFVIGAVLTLAAVNTKNSVSFFGISAVILITEGIAYNKIEALSIYSIFRYINIISFTKAGDIFCNYKNINFWEYPIPLISASFTAVITISLICVILSAFLYAKKRNLEFRRIGLKFIKVKEKRVRSRLYYTFSKSLILQKGIYILLVFIAVSVFMTQNFTKEYDVSDVYYKFYTTQLEGDITNDTLGFCDNEAARFDDINTRITELQETVTGYSKELNDLYNDLAPSIGFYPFQERVKEVKDIDNAQIFYDTGYKRIFGLLGYDDDMKYALASMLLCVLLISPMIANDNKYRMKLIINSSMSGRKQYVKQNVTAASIYGCLSGLIWIIGYSVDIYKFYGFSGLNALIQSMTDYLGVPLDIKIWQYISLIYLLRIIFIISASLIMLFISSKCKNTTMALLVNFAVFALPLVIYLLGADVMVNIGFNPLLSVNALLNNFSIVQLVFPVAILGLLIGIKIKAYRTL